MSPLQRIRDIYPTISADAIAVAKTMFSMMTVRGELRYDNVKGRAPARMKAALDELVKLNIIEHQQDEKADIYRPDLDCDFTMFRQMGMPSVAKDLILSEDIPEGERT